MNENMENLLAKQRAKNDIRARTKNLTTPPNLQPNSQPSHPNVNTKNPRDPYFHRFNSTDINIVGIHKLWYDWLAVHTILPEEVNTAGWVYRDLQRCQVHYRAFVYDPITKKLMIDREKFPHHPVTTTRIIRLESPPLIFPYLPIDRIISDLRTITPHDTANTTERTDN